MNRVELPHDKARFGPLRAAVEGRPELVRLVALIRVFADAEDRALPAAAGLVLDQIQGLELFELSAAGDAQIVGAAQAFSLVWPGGDWGMDGPAYSEPESDLRRGPAGALAAMRRHWAESPERDAECPKRGWDTDQCAGLAILRARAEALFPEVFGQAEAVQAPGLEATGERQLLQPAGGTWPHPPEQPWTEAERCALFEMRHRLKFTGSELAEVAGVSRQRVDELIGPAKPHGGLGKIVAKDGGWTPPAALLALCRVPLQPLQVVSATLVAA